MAKVNYETVSHEYFVCGKQNEFVHNISIDTAVPFVGNTSLVGTGWRFAKCLFFFRMETRELPNFTQQDVFLLFAFIQKKKKTNIIHMDSNWVFIFYCLNNFKCSENFFYREHPLFVNIAIVFGSAWTITPIMMWRIPKTVSKN